MISESARFLIDQMAGSEQIDVSGVDVAAGPRAEGPPQNTRVLRLISAAAQAPSKAGLEALTASQRAAIARGRCVRR